MTISTLPALSRIRTWPETGPWKLPFPGRNRQFPSKAEIQGALAYPSDQNFPESQEYGFPGTCPETTEKGQNPARAGSRSSLITVWSGSGKGSKRSLFRVPPVCQKWQKHSPFCLVRDPAFPGIRGTDPGKPRVDLGSCGSGQLGVSGPGPLGLASPIQPSPGCYPTLTPDRPGSIRVTGRERPKMQERKRASALPTPHHPEEKEALSPGGRRWAAAAAPCGTAGTPGAGVGQGVPGVHGTPGTMVLWYTTPTHPGGNIPGCQCAQSAHVSSMPAGRTITLLPAGLRFTETSVIFPWGPLPPRKDYGRFPLPTPAGNKVIVLPADIFLAGSNFLARPGAE